MTVTVPSGGLAVMANRREPPDSLDFFPTPPWATRALFPFLGDETRTVWEPAAGMGHMAAVLGEHFDAVFSSDVHDYGIGATVGSFVGEGPDVAQCVPMPDWIITNPPFNLAMEFAHRALRTARIGVALLTRTAWLEGGERYRELFEPHPPSIIALFSERVPMVKGRWDPKASTATSYAWVVWGERSTRGTRLSWIPPGQRERLTKPDDVFRFAGGRP